MRANFFVVASPFGDLHASLRQRSEPLLVQAFIAEFALEAFDVTVLHRPARLDQQMLDLVLLRPCQEHTTGEHVAVEYIGTEGPVEAFDQGFLINSPVIMVRALNAGWFEVPMGLGRCG